VRYLYKMEDLTGTFINKVNNAKITLYPDKSFSITDLGGSSYLGKYWLEESNIAGFPYYLVLQRNDAQAKGIDRALINIISPDVFRVFDRQFWEIEDTYNSEEAVYIKEN
jgi:hypothetical protein